LYGNNFNSSHTHTNYASEYRARDGQLRRIRCCQRSLYIGRLQYSRQIALDGIGLDDWHYQDYWCPKIFGVNA